MRVHTTEQLSARQSKTPEGYLLCEGVAIGRTGYQLYKDGELPLTADQDGLITVHRRESEVFDPESMASFEGKPVTIEHPADGVDPSNWQTLSVGLAQNIRRGVGLDADLLIADLLVTDADAIEKVTARPGEAMRDVSCGYDAEYIQTAIGAAYQENIVGNHVAIVPRGRAGPRCSIQDKAPIMATKPKTPAWLNKLRAAFATKDADAFEKAITSEDADEDDDEDPKKKTADSAAIATLTKTVDALTKTVDALTKARTKDDGTPGINEVPNTKVRVTNDEDDDEEEATMVGDSMRAFAADAEILSPGFKLSTHDSVNIKTRDHVAAAQRRALTAAAKIEDGKVAVDALLGGRTLDKLTTDAIGVVFSGAAAMMRSANNAARGQRTASAKTKDFGTAPKTPADINAANQAFWSRSKT